MPHGIFEEKVSITDEHRYFDKSGNEYMGFTKLFELISKPFDKEFIAKQTAKSRGCETLDVLNEWEDKRDNGTRIDDAITLFNETGLVSDENADIKDIILSVSDEYKKYAKNISQMIVFDEDSKTAGTLDRLFLFTHRKDSAFGLSDFKVFEKDDLYIRRGWLLEPFNHLPATKFVKISFQLSLYAYHFEKLTGKKCNELFIHIINPISKEHHKVYCPYLKNDIKLLLSHLKPKIQELMTAKNFADEAF